jgi:hypothetical protein
MTNAVTLAQYGGVSPSWRNRIINGGMTIDQRNAGASVSFNNSSNFAVDRFKTYCNVGTGNTVQRSSTAPTGFSNSMLFTVGTSGAPGAAEEARFFQSIEGYNVNDLGFGTAYAKTVTVSFWVRSSITGTYALNLRNDAGTRSYVATYSVDAANTWEYKTATIPGCTDGTWETTTSTGIMLRFDLGSGSNANTTAGAWQNGNYGRTSACVNWIATNGATFYITGVQLEVGTAATQFEFRDYTRELQMCQRYYVMWASGVDSGMGIAAFNTAKTPQMYLYPPVAMRTTPTLDQTATQYRFNTNVDENIAAMSWTIATSESTATKARINGSVNGSTTNTGAAGACRIYTGGGYFALNAEL